MVKGNAAQGKHHQVLCAVKSVLGSATGQARVSRRPTPAGASPAPPGGLSWSTGAEAACHRERLTPGDEPPAFGTYPAGRAGSWLALTSGWPRPKARAPRSGAQDRHPHGGPVRGRAWHAASALATARPPLEPDPSRQRAEGRGQAVQEPQVLTKAPRCTTRSCGGAAGRARGEPDTDTRGRGGRWHALTSAEPQVLGTW